MRLFPFQLAAHVTCLASSMMLAACAGSTPNPPSLMPRAAETVSLDEPAAVPVVLAPLPGAIVTRADALVAQARKAAGASAKLSSSASPGGARGSDPWIQSEMIAAAAEVALVPARGALGEAEKLIADAATAGQEQSALVAARNLIAGLVARQQARLDVVRLR